MTVLSFLRLGVDSLFKIKVNLYNKLFEGLFFIFLGVLFLKKWIALWALIHLILTGVFIYHGVAGLISFLSKKEKKLITLVEVLFSFSVAIYALSNPLKFVQFIPFIIGLWAFIHGIVQSINYYVYRKDCLRGTGWRLVIVLVTFTLSILLLLSPARHLRGLSILAGFYLIFYGVVNASVVIKDLISPVFKRKMIKHMSISVPIIISALLPTQAFLSVKSLKNTKNSDEKVPCDLEVFTYLSNNGPESLGHTDICYKGKIYSYGCHDPENRKLMGTLGDGVLIVSDRNSFLEHALTTENKIVIGYGINLTEEQKKIVEERIDEMMSRTIPWQFALAKGENQAKDYASRVYRGTRAEMFKFTEGKFRTYFVFSTNCVLLADHLLRCPQLDLFNFVGIVTPGSYLSFLNDEYLRKGSLVVSRSVYRRDINV